MIGLVGYGRFGRLVVKHLATNFEIMVYTRDKDKEDDITRAGGHFVDIENACSQKVVILCVPISVMKATLKEVTPYLNPGTIVVDVCSVKINPVKWMVELLPSDVEILATHPMFGPDSADENLNGHKIVTCPIRIDSEHYSKIVTWLKGNGLNVIETSPEEHDRQIAVSLAMTHFVGRSMAEFGASSMNIDTEGYRRLIHVLEVVNNDTWQLFNDMNRYNPYARDTRLSLLNAFNKVNASIEED